MCDMHDYDFYRDPMTHNWISRILTRDAFTKFQYKNRISSSGNVPCFVFGKVCFTTQSYVGPNRGYYTIAQHVDQLFHVVISEEIDVGSFLLHHHIWIEVIMGAGRHQRQGTVRQRVRYGKHGSVRVPGRARRTQRGRRRIYPLLLLPPIAKPHPHYLFLHAKSIR